MARATGGGDVDFTDGDEFMESHGVPPPEDSKADNDTDADVDGYDYTDLLWWAGWHC